MKYEQLCVRVLPLPSFASAGSHGERGGLTSAAVAKKAPVEIVTRNFWLAVCRDEWHLCIPQRLSSSPIQQVLNFHCL